MCRLLFVKSKSPFSIKDHLEKFAALAKNSKEFQGHGWGCAYLVAGEWSLYKNIHPIWQDDFSQFRETTLLLAHARSAFRDEGIHVDNNMPFQNDRLQFIFNGELHGVKIKEQGRIGAEKIFNYLLRFHHGDLLAAMRKGVDIIAKRSSYIRAMNIIISDKDTAIVSTTFNEAADYFTMHYKKNGHLLTICSDPYPNETGWNEIANNTTEVFDL
jgi:predicted glutamine amidotransferase